MKRTEAREEETHLEKDAPKGGEGSLKTTPSLRGFAAVIRSVKNDPGEKGGIGQRTKKEAKKP